jgi:DNA adenine methylase
MKAMTGALAAPFPYFGGKALAVEQVWAAFGNVSNYVEPFFGSGAMLLGAPDFKRVETVNDFDGFVSNFWRAIAHDPEAVAHHANWPCNENDLFARHGWLVRQREIITERLHADPDWFDAKAAGWWVWGACNWIGSGWCEGTGPWVHDGESIVKRDAGRGINRQLPHLSAGQGGEHPRAAYISEWFGLLHDRLRDVRVACGDWKRVLTDSVTTRHGFTAVFLDPPYEKGAMDYGAGGMGKGIAESVREWCIENGNNKAMRIVLCGHAGEHDDLLNHGWHIRNWTARKGYAVTDEAVANSASETLWCSPHCVPVVQNFDLFGVAV